MNFLNPALLAGLAALAIPIIVHFLNRRKFRKVPWAAMRFLQVSIERNKRRMQVEDWILLAVRLLMVALLVLALARPALERLKLASLAGGVASAVILDTSGSMNRTDSGSASTRFEAGRAAGHELLEGLPGGSSVSFTYASDGSPSLAPSGDLGRIRKALDKATPTHRSGDLSPSINAALASLETRTASGKELVVITDGEASGWREFETISRALETKSEDIRAVIAIIGGKAGENLGLTRLEQSSPIAAVGAPLRLSLEVGNFGSSDAENVTVSLLVDSEPAGAPVELEIIPVGESRTATVFVRLPSPGYHRITASLIGGDALPADDSRTLIVNAIAQERALLVDGRPGRDRASSATYFLQNALVPVPSEAAEGFYIATDTISVTELAATELGNYRAVFLADVAEFPTEATALLEGFVRDGGGLIVFAGEGLNRSFYNNSLHAKSGLLPAAFGEPVEDPPALQTSGFDHPLVALWNDSGASTLSTIGIAKALPLILPEGSGAAVALRFGDGTPAVVESDYGLGSVYQFAITADTSWTDLPVRPAFLPIVQRLYGSVLAVRDSGLNLNVGETFSRRGPATWVGKSAMVYAVGSGTSKGALLPIVADGDGSRVEFNETDLAGAYEFALADPPVNIPFAANPSPRESDPEPLSSAQLDRLRSLAEVVVAADGESLSEALGRERSGTELWPILLLIVGLLAIVELFLSQRFSQQK